MIYYDRVRPQNNDPQIILRKGDKGTKDQKAKKTIEDVPGLT